MQSHHSGLVTRIWYKLFPPAPNFHALLNNQAKLMVEATSHLYEFMCSGNEMHASHVIELEHKGDKIKTENMAILHQAFATPFDREDIYRAIAAIDEVLNYTKTTVREMQALQLGPDEHTCLMAEQLYTGAVALQQGYARLAKQPLLSEKDAEAARKTERKTEKLYRKALSELFDAEHYVSTLTPEQEATENSLEVLMQQLNTRELAAVGSAIGFVIEILKRREIYRHMSNAADRIVKAGEVLDDIVAKIA